MLSGPAASLVYYRLGEAWMAWIPIALLAGFFLFRLKRRAVLIGATPADRAARPGAGAAACAGRSGADGPP